MNPFVVEKGFSIKAVIISYKADQEFLELLYERNIDIIFTIPNENIQIPVMDHPDMSIHPVDGNTFVVDRKYYEYYNDKLMGYGKSVIPSHSKLGKDYPQDVLLNVGRYGGYFICKKNCIDKELENRLIAKNLKPLYMNQGYAKCSMMILGDGNIITSDRSIFDAIEKKGGKSYMIPSGDILLPGYNTGFIGGTCGMISSDEILFYGDLDLYEHGDMIKKILFSHKIKPVYPKGIPFVDRGSIIAIY